MASGDASEDVIDNRPLSPILTSARSNRPYAYHRKCSNKRRSRVSLLEKFQSKSESSILQSKLELDGIPKSHKGLQTQQQLDLKPKLERDAKLKDAFSIPEKLQTVSQVGEEYQNDIKLQETLVEHASKTCEKSSNAADRIRRIEQIKIQRKKYYEILANHVGSEKVVRDVSAINNKDDFEFKKPISPVSDLKFKKFRGTEHSSHTGMSLYFVNAFAFVHYCFSTLFHYVVLI